MMDGRAISRNGIPIRLTDERWNHILEGHAELEGHQAEVLIAIENADRVLEGHDGAMMAIKTNRNAKLLVVVYREQSGDDGFIVTAFFTRRVESLAKRRQLWP